MGGSNQTLLSAAIFLVIAVVIISVRDITEALPGAVDGFGPDALPFACDFTRDGTGADDMDARFTLIFDDTRAGDFPHCATLTRGTALRPRSGGEVLCFAHLEGRPQDLWGDSAGGSLQIFGNGGARYAKHERAPGADAFAPTGDVAYAGSCERPK